jgi:hypothetical protein
VLPVAYYLLERTFRSARHVRDYTAEILEAAEGINRNVLTAIELDRLPEATSKVRDALTPVLVEAGDLQRTLRRG